MELKMFTAIRVYELVSVSLDSGWKTRESVASMFCHHTASSLSHYSYYLSKRDVFLLPQFSIKEKVHFLNSKWLLQSICLLQPMLRVDGTKLRWICPQGPIIIFNYYNSKPKRAFYPRYPNLKSEYSQSQNPP